MPQIHIYRRNLESSLHAENAVYDYIVVYLTRSYAYSKLIADYKDWQLFQKISKPSQESTVKTSRHIFYKTEYEILI